MNPLAKQLNKVIESSNPPILEMLSDVGKNLFFPKGILSQSAEAKEKAHDINATIGIATEKNSIMYLPSVINFIKDIAPEDSLTYAPSFGNYKLRQLWQKSLFAKNPSLSGKSISIPVVTGGITHGISLVADMWISPDDVVILPEMTWGNYSLILTVKHQATVSTYPMFSDEGCLNLNAFEKKVNKEASKKDKIIVLLNFPHNPSGYTPTVEEGNRIVDILDKIARKGTKVVAIIDDAYFGLFYENHTLQESLFAHLCDKHSNILAIKLDGATKENFVWGLRIGFITYGSKIDNNALDVYDALEKKTAGCVRGSVSNVSHLSQTIISNSMQNKDFEKEKNKKHEILNKRALRVKQVLSDPKYNDSWDVYPFNSGYFMCIRLKSVDAEALRCHLLEKYGVGLISIGQKNLRIAFSCLEENEIKKLFDIIYKGIKEIN